MAETILVDGVDRSDVVHREDCEWAESAYLGETGEGKVVIHDDAGTITAAGFKDVTVEQSSSTPARIMTAFVGKKTIRRGSFLANFETSREYSFATKDGNDLLGRLKIRAAAGNRTATDATVATELTWLLADELSRVGVADYGRVEYPDDVGIDPVDRRGQFPGDVLSELAKACRRNYYVRWNTTEAGWELVFRDDNASTDDDAGIAISNAGDDDGVTIFAPSMDDELTEDPEHVYSGVRAIGAKTNTYRTRPATAAAFVERDGETEDSGVKNLATLQRDGDTFLYESRLEEQVLPVKLHMRAAQVNLILPGQRVPTRMLHMTPEGWNPARYARVLRRRVTQPVGTDFDYEVALDLSPQEAGPPAARILQSVFGATADGGGTLTLPNPVTIGSSLVFCISASHANDPAAPNTSPSLFRWGPGAWTKRPNSTIKNGYGTGEGEGIAIWTKTSDSVDRTGYIGSAAAAVGIFELADADLSSATTVSQTLQSAANPMVVGSLGTAIAGSIAIMVGNWADASLVVDGHSSLPTWDGSANGWTEDQLYVVPAVYPRWNPPVSYIAHALGSGSSITAGGSRSSLQWLPGQWAATAILIPPL